jgi:pyruvate dehydrogenase E2 component (dihydrolipoamide acetyltransferase)
MAEIVRMPKLSDTMTEGVVAKWHKKVGDSVKTGELLADIETDKATMEFESFQDGVLLYIGVEEGKSAAVDSILAILGNANEDFKALLATEKPAEPKIATQAPEEQPIAKLPKLILEEVSQPTLAALPIAESKILGGQRLKASPLAKALAKQKGIDLERLKGSGDGGRVVKQDVENYTPNFVDSRTIPEESFTEVPVSQMRKTIARRLAESKFSAPHFYLTLAIEMDKLIEARIAINEISPVKISINDLIIKASALALKKHPAINSSWLGEKIRYNNHVHIGVAVAVEDGLLVPVVRFADSKILSEIAAEVKGLSKKAKEKKLQPAEWQGNTFTISNLGMFGIESFTAIINSPDACILAVGGIAEIPVVKNGHIVPGNVMKVTLSCDHRVVDGASGAAFLQTLKKLLENPILLVGSGNI